MKKTSSTRLLSFTFSQRPVSPLGFRAGKERGWLEMEGDITLRFEKAKTSSGKIAYFLTSNDLETVEKILNMLRSDDGIQRGAKARIKWKRFEQFENRLWLWKEVGYEIEDMTEDDIEWLVGRMQEEYEELTRPTVLTYTLFPKGPVGAILRARERREWME